ncbi:MAG: sulfur carrier protein ThiS [Nibricoccus sp.]
MNESATAAGSAASMTIFVNDQARPLASDTLLANLLGELGLAERKGIAAALNGAVVPRRDWQTRRLTAGDRVIVIQATQGG